MTLERCSPEECVFSVEDINIADWKINFKYRQNKDTEKGKFISLIEGESLQVVSIGRCVYFLVTRQFFTGYQHEFRMCMTSADGETVQYHNVIDSIKGELFVLYYLMFLIF